MAKLHLEGGVTFEGTPEEIKAYTDLYAVDTEKAEPAQKLKAGDFVTIDTRKYNLDITEGKAYEVFDDNGELYFLDDAGDKRTSWFPDEAYEIVAPPTVFERIGRKEGEFKVGDVVRVSTRADAHKVAGSLVTIAEFREGGNCGGLAWFEDYGHSITGQYLELIAPVESRVDAN